MFKQFWAFLNTDMYDIVRRETDIISDEKRDLTLSDEEFEGLRDEDDLPIDYMGIERKLNKNELNEFAKHFNLAKTINDFVVVDDNGNAVAMDAGNLNEITSIKSTFSLDTNRAPDVLMFWYVRQTFIGYQTCSFLAQHWLINRACSIPGKDAVRNGYKLTTMGGKKLKPAVIDDINELDEEVFNIREELKHHDRNMRIFGIGISYLKIKSKDKKFYQKPFNIDGITEGSYEGIVTLDPIWITPELRQQALNPSSEDFYEPTYWRVDGQAIHKSHLIITRYANPTTVLQPTYIYGGIPLSQLLYERVYAAERTNNEIPAIVQTKRLHVLRTNTKQALMRMGDLTARLNVFARFKDNHGVQIIDEDEEITQYQTQLTDLRDVTDGQYATTAAISGVPETKLMMRPIAGGLSNAGDGDNRNYNDMVEDVQTDMSKLLRRHHEVLIKSHIEPNHGKQPRIKHVWNPIRSLDAREIAEKNKANAETDKIYLEYQVVDIEEVRARLAADEHSGYTIDQEDVQEEVDYSQYHEGNDENAESEYRI